MLPPLRACESCRNIFHFADATPPMLRFLEDADRSFFCAFFDAADAFADDADD